MTVGKTHRRRDGYNAVVVIGRCGDPDCMVCAALFDGGVIYGQRLASEWMERMKQLCQDPDCVAQRHPGHHEHQLITPNQAPVRS